MKDYCMSITTTFDIDDMHEMAKKISKLAIYCQYQHNDKDFNEVRDAMYNEILGKIFGLYTN